MFRKNGFVAFSVTVITISAFGCGGCPQPESKPDRFKYPIDRSIQRVTGKLLVGHGAFSEDQDNLSKFIKFASLNSQDAVDGMGRRKEIDLIENGSRVKVRYSDQFDSMVKVDVMDGIHAGKTGWMHVLECGGALNKVTPSTAKQSVSKPKGDSVPPTSIQTKKNQIDK